MTPEARRPREGGVYRPGGSDSRCLVRLGWWLDRRNGALKHDTVVVVSALGVVGQIIVAVLLVVGMLALIGVRGPLDGVRRLLWGWELWGAFVIAAVGTGGSLFFSEIALYPPCELCWYQRICMYPLSILALLLASRADNRAARYLLPLPVVGAGVSIYHLLVQTGAVRESLQCSISAPGGCAGKWINEFGYVTIPVLALTGFLLLIGFLLLGSIGTAEDTSAVPAHAER